MNIFVEPNDVLMFRDGRPFSGGEDHLAHCIFPPFPSTLYGALRSHILSLHFPDFEKFADKREDIPDNIKNDIGTYDSYGNLTITNFCVAKLEKGIVTPYFHVPFDVVGIKSDEEKSDIFLMKPEKNILSLVVSDRTSMDYLWIKSSEFFEPVNGYLSGIEMEKYLLGNVPAITENRDIFVFEDRTGIGKNLATRSVEKGRLYSVDYIRLNSGVGFLIGIANTNLLPKKGILRVGGDGRSMTFFECDGKEISYSAVKQMVAKNKRFKLILITPAILKRGWLFSWMDEKSMIGSVDGVEIKLVCAAVSRPKYVGGFDLARKMPKDMKKAVPAGSVYYFEIIKGDTDKIFDIFWMKSISEEKSQEGFGLTIIGGY